MRLKINREEVFNKCGGHCAYCGEQFNSIKDMQVDHVIAKQNKYEILNNLKTNIDDISNLLPSCRSCNKFKDTFKIEDFRKNIKYQIEKFRKHHPTFRLAERYGLVSCNEDLEVKFYYETIN